MDRDSGDQKANHGRGEVPQVRVSAESSIQHAGVRYAPNWPFLYNWREGKVWLNRAPRRKPDMTSMEDALW